MIGCLDSAGSYATKSTYSQGEWQHSSRATAGEFDGVFEVPRLFGQGIG
jgi:hypothetical protein